MKANLRLSIKDYPHEWQAGVYYESPGGGQKSAGKKSLIDNSLPVRERGSTTKDRGSLNGLNKLNEWEGDGRKGIVLLLVLVLEVLIDFSAVPSRLDGLRAADPALKRWAIVGRPFGTWGQKARI